jgi:hypothetical protein
MAQRYASFLIRCWRLGEEVERIKVEHIQSGESAQVTTIEAAFAWIGQRRFTPNEATTTKVDHVDQQDSTS